MHSAWAQSLWVAFFASALLAYPCLLLLRKMRSESVINPYAPETHKTKTGTPNMGGIFVVVAVAIATLVANSDRSEPAKYLLPLLGFALVGFIDDFVMPRFTTKRGLGWLPKLAMQFGVAGVWAWMVGFTAETAVAAFLIVVFANAVNFADGLDALAGSLLLFAFLPLGVYFGIMRFEAPMVAAIAVAGAILPFLFLNAPPAKVFMGDVGSLALGALFGQLFATLPWKSTPWPWAIAFVFIVEFALVPIQIIAVKTIKRRLFPATPIHHGFEKMGWPETRVVWTFALVQIALSAYALTEVLS